MQSLLTSLLEYSRVANQPPRHEPVRLDAALDDALANLRLRLLETGARVERGPLPTLRGDPAQWTRVFQNLVENSLKYANGRAPRVRVAARREGASWVVTVDDDGPGFPARGRERLFLPFSRLHGADVAGAGLGLASVRAVIERHGGTIEALDAPGGGARILLRIPGDP